MALDLRAINEAVLPVPSCPYSYSLLSQIHTGSPVTVLDLKDACFCFPRHQDSQLFAFEWKDPNTQIAQQLTWTVLPQGFWDSPPLFGKTLAEDLSLIQLPLGLSFSNFQMTPYL
jgi:hypothetical protein